MRRLQTAKPQSTFLVNCDADGQHRFRGEADSLWLNISQQVRLHNASQMWDSVAVECRQLSSGSLEVRVIVFNPDWDEPLQIASIQSRPDDPDCLTALGCNFNHVAI